jgi:hypothetical protein
MPVGQRSVANTKCIFVGYQLTHLQLLMLTTNLPESVRQSNSEEAVSVIHAPESFANWVCSISLYLGCDIANPLQVAPAPVMEQKGPSPRTSPKSEVESLTSVNGASEKVRCLWLGFLFIY